MNGPNVAVVMAIKNAERYLRQALDSVSEQTFKDFEIVVVDGGSTDAGREIASSYERVTCIDQQGTGFADAWNSGILASRAPFITFLDSDDIWLPQKLSSQLCYFDRHPTSQYVIGRVQFFVDPDQSIPAGFKPELLEGSHIAYMPGTSMIRREVFEKFGTFQDRWKIASDIEWFVRLRQSPIQSGVVDEVVLRKRVHATNLSYVTDGLTYRGELLKLLKESVDRHRQARKNGGIAAR